MPLDYHLIRSRRRSLELRIYPDHRLEVRAPMRTRQRDIDAFVASRRDWIERKRAAMPPPPPPPDFGHGSLHLYLGERRPLHLESGRHRVSFDNGAIRVRTSDIHCPDAIAGSLEKGYREAARSLFDWLIDKHFPWFAERGHRRPRLRVKKMKTRWGSLSQRGYINLNMQLVKTPVECIEYVVVHELCHLEEANHGPGFHALMDRHLPDWRRRRDVLNRSPLS